MDSKYKKLSQANMAFKNDEIIQACVLYKKLLLFYTEEDISFYSLIINNIIENFYVLKNNERYLLLQLNDNKIKCEIKPEGYQYLCRLLLCSDYQTRILSIEFLKRYFTDEMFNLSVKYTILSLLDKETTTYDEVISILSLISLFFSVFGDYFIKNLKLLTTKYSHLYSNIKDVIEKNYINIDISILNMGVKMNSNINNIEVYELNNN